MKLTHGTMASIITQEHLNAVHGAGCLNPPIREENAEQALKSRSMISSQSDFPMETPSLLEGCSVENSSFSHFILSLPDILEKETNNKLIVDKGQKPNQIPSLFPELPHGVL